MRHLLIIGKSAKEIAGIKQSCSMSFIIDSSEHLNEDAFLESDYSAILMLLDDDPKQYLVELEQYTLNPLSSNSPVIIATRNPDPQYIRQAIRRGAVDYVDLRIHYFLINNRIRNVMRLSLSQPAHDEALNRLLFYRCIGAAMMIQVSADETMVQATMINNDFFQTVGIPKDFYASHPNLLETALPEEMEGIRQAIHLANTNGVGECTYSNPALHRTFRGTYHFVSRNELTHSSTMLLTLKDVTETMMQKSMQENMLRLPGMTLFTYEPETDTLHFLITTKKNKKVSISHPNVTDASQQKVIAPESFLLFQRTIRKALTGQVTGNIDVRVLFGNELKWYRMYYRSIPGGTGGIDRIVGRLDNLESEDFLEVKGIHSGLCDAETHLPTFRSTFQFVEQILHDHKQGTLLLLNISGLTDASERMSTLDYQEFLQSIVRTMNNQFISTDLIGRFDDECFVAFMPETTSRNLAPRKAEKLIRAVEEILPHDGFKVNSGICIIGPQHGTLDSIISEANIALWQAMEAGHGQYRIFDNDRAE